MTTNTEATSKKTFISSAQVWERSRRTWQFNELEKKQNNCFTKDAVENFHPIKTYFQVIKVRLPAGSINVFLPLMLLQLHKKKQKKNQPRHVLRWRLTVNTGHKEYSMKDNIYRPLYTLWLDDPLTPTAKPDLLNVSEQTVVIYRTAWT